MNNLCLYDIWKLKLEKNIYKIIFFNITLKHFILLIKPQFEIPRGSIVHNFSFKRNCYVNVTFRSCTHMAVTYCCFYIYFDQIIVFYVSFNYI